MPDAVEPALRRGLGRLEVVATPIGNLGDLTPRARDSLAAADVVAAEDTRRTGQLLAALGLRKPMVSLHAHNERGREAGLLARLEAGEVVALVSDAGTPGISDPGERLVKAALNAGITVSAIPGPSALTMALVISGLPTARFVFEGFLPRSGSDRSRRIDDVAAEMRTVVLYEAPHRLEKTLDDLETACGAMRRVVLARELTKLHEEMWRGTLHDAVKYAQTTEPRGEYVLILEGAKPPAPPTDEEINDALRDELRNGSSKKDAAAKVAAKYGIQKRHVYELALMLK